MARHLPSTLGALGLMSFPVWKEEGEKGSYKCVSSFIRENVKEADDCIMSRFQGLNKSVRKWLFLILFACFIILYKISRRSEPLSLASARGGGRLRDG